MLYTVKWGKKVSCGGVFDLAVEQPQLFRKLPKNKKKYVNKLRREWSVRPSNQLTVAKHATANQFAEVLEYLLLHVSAISCNVVCSILELHAWKTLTQQW